MIAIVNYGLGNLYSVAGAVERLGYEVRISNKPEELEAAEKLILPGVGAFGDGIKKLRETGLEETLNKLVLDDKKPVLGICLGFQLMAKESFEFGHHKGLGWFDGSVVKMKTGRNLRLPHVGWNDLFQTRKNFLFDGIPDKALFYYVHSFQVVCNDPEDVIGESSYGSRVTAAVSRGNINGTQFHPEKSQQWGLKLLGNFLKKA